MSGSAMGFQLRYCCKANGVNSFKASRSNTAIRSTASEVISNNPSGLVFKTAKGEATSGNRYKVTIKKPLGIILEQSFGSNVIYVDSIVEGGNAERTGLIRKGDQLISTSGVIYTTERSYGDTMVKGGQKVVRLNVLGESFNAVLSAIGSHPGHIPVELEFESKNGSNVVATSSDDAS